MKPATGERRSPRPYAVLRSAAVLVGGAVVFYALSFVSYFAFFFAARLTHSVPVARACDAVGAVFLWPGRLVLGKLPAFMVFLPSVIIPANTSVWMVLFCVWMLIRAKGDGGR